MKPPPRPSQPPDVIWCGPDCWRCLACGSVLALADWDEDRFRVWNDKHKVCQMEER